MLRRPLLFLFAAGIPASFSSCGLIKVPFKVVGAVAEGTAHVGKKAATATADVFSKTEEEKAAEAKEKKRKEAAEKKAAGKVEATEVRESVSPAVEPEALPDDYLPPLPGTDQPLPGDAPLPYQGQ